MKGKNLFPALNNVKVTFTYFLMWIFNNAKLEKCHAYAL